MDVKLIKNLINLLECLWHKKVFIWVTPRIFDEIFMPGVNRMWKFMDWTELFVDFSFQLFRNKNTLGFDKYTY